MSYKREKLDEKFEQTRIDNLRAQYLEPSTDEDELKYQTILGYCRQNNTTFHDGEFPLTKANLGKRFLKRGREFEMAFSSIRKESKTDLARKWLKQKSSATWQRVGDENYEKMANLLDPNSDQNLNQNLIPKMKLQIWRAKNEFNVYQNGFGNCALIAALSAISAHKGLLEFLLRDFKVCEEGVYQVKLCMDGAWSTVVVDDWMPAFDSILACTCTERGFSLNKEIWPALLEKALAKVYGGYQKMHGFNSLEALSLLTGTPTKDYIVKDFKDKPEELWEMLREASTNFFPMVCGTKGKSEIQKKHGKTFSKLTAVSPNHGYTIVSCMDYKKDDVIHKLIRLRNPWGMSEWAGRFSKFEDTLPVILKDWFQNRWGFITGTFWMELDEFMDHFNHLTISRYRDSWKEIRFNMPIGGMWDDTQKMIKITVPKPAEISVSAIKPNYFKRRYHTWISIYQMDPLDSDKIGKIVICEPVDKWTKDIKIDAGDYFIMISNFYQSSKKEERNISIHSSVEISGKLCSWSPQIEVGVLQKVVEKKGVNILKERPEISIKKYSSEEFVVVMAENHTSDKYLHVHTRCSKIERCWMSRGDVYNHYFGDVIYPRSRQILILIYRNSEVKQKRFPMNIDYFLSKERVTKIGRKDPAEHIPALAATDYVHETVFMD